jgi:hypothetical protein
MPPKYHHQYYNLGTYYPNWAKSLQDVVDQALNMISPTSPAGRVLNGQDGNKCSKTDAFSLIHPRRGLS